MGQASENGKPKLTVKSIQQMKGKEKIVAITAYDALWARMVDPYVDLVLVGDSVGNTMLGYEDTVSVTLDVMKHHAAAAARAQPQSLLVVDLPFSLAYQSMDLLLDSCRQLMQIQGVQAIKIEVGDESLFQKIRTLIKAGIPILGHIGLLPQNINALGNYRSYGNRESGKKRLIDWALALQDAGCFCVLGEAIKAHTAAEITQALNVPFIGIGCGAECDGQILVITDVLGMSEYIPGFATVFADLKAPIKKGMEDYSDAVKAGKFPN